MQAIVDNPSKTILSWNFQAFSPASNTVYGVASRFQPQVEIVIGRR